jgi:protein ImuB
MFAVIHIPNFALQAALRLEPELKSCAVALVDSEPGKATIMQLTSAARERGAFEGSTPSQAVARCGDLVIKQRSRAREQSATEILLQTACAFSPYIESTASGVCTMELKGLALENEAAARQWASKILSALASFHLDAQIGFASAPGLALVLAQAANPIFFAENPIEFAMALPIDALHPPQELAGILSLWGVGTIGAFLALGKDNVAERLGPEAAVLFDRLDSLRPLDVIAPPETFAERIEFEHEIETAEPLLFVLRRMLEQLAARLEMIYLVVGGLDFELTLASGEKYERTFKIPSPTNNIQVLFRMLQTHLETLRTESPIVALQLQAQPANPEQHQFGLFETTLRDPNQFAETLARLTALCGSENIGTPQLKATHRPDAFRMAVPDFANSVVGTSRPLAIYRSCDVPARVPAGGTACRGCPPCTIVPSPDATLGDGDGAARRVPTANAKTGGAQVGMQLRRFRPALRAVVEFREDRPALIRSQTFNGPINDARGPFLASGEWWDVHGWAREEWDVQMADGAVCRIFRSADGCFVEGVYD